MTDGRRRSASAERQRRYRQRVRGGKRVFRLELDEVDWEARLIAGGYLPEGGADDFETLNRALLRAINNLHPFARDA